MKTINQLKLGVAGGITGAAVYIGCFLLMAILGQDSLVQLANLLFHGIDFSNIIRMDIPIGETILGVFVSFIFWGLLAYLMGLFYNKLKIING